jgi:HK97 gp10 family phage protein
MAEFIAGMDSLQQKLRSLEQVVQRKILIAAAKAGAAIVRDEAQRLAPRDTGALAEGMTIKANARQSDSREATVEVGPGKDEFYGMFQELGTAFHSAQPFLGPALENKKTEVFEAMKQKAEEEIDKATR